MLFNSLPFAFFMVAVFFCYWGLSSSVRTQNIFLLCASYFFYGWYDWRYLSLIIACTAINYVGGRVIGTSHSRLVKKSTLVFCCILSFGILFIFKYYNFFIENFNAICSSMGIHWHGSVVAVMLPVGISFFTFQAVSYTIDVYNEKYAATKDWVSFFTFISFFPQLVAGPIERADNLLPQFLRARRFDGDKAIHGVALIAYGLFKKMVVADTISVYVDNVFRTPLVWDSSTCLIAIFFFSVQIYCDFSGYSDIARGSARLIGFDLMINFNRPYLSLTFSEFWKRWHISLSTWFRDYVYIPLGGNRVSIGKVLLNLWIVFLLSGLWHGADWTFVVWGALHALYLSLGVIYNRIHKQNDKNKWCRRGVVFLGTMFAWIFFRAENINAAFDFIKSLASMRLHLSISSLCPGIGGIYLAFCFMVVALLGLSYLAPADCRFRSVKGSFLFVLGCLVAISFLGVSPEGEFIYFRF